MTSWHSYPKLWNLGHAAIKELLFDEVVVEEKVDGSQFSFGVFDGELKVRSKGVEMAPDAPEKMFSKAVETVLSLKEMLIPGWTYSAEYLQKPKHNVLAYDRVPKGHLIIFDIRTEEEQYASYEAKRGECDRMGLECVPLLFRGKITTPTMLLDLLERVSVLGGQKIEGFVIKNYARFGADKKALMGKHVSESFKEKHKVDFKEGNPGPADIVQRLINAFRTPARWDKAIIHLRERGQLEGSPRDIGMLIKEAQKDLSEECSEEIRDALLAWALPQVLRGSTSGLPEYYKENLLARQFESESA